MKDAEFIYSLYVQANPVPDPDLLPLTRDEAALLSFERSPDMMNQEQTNKNLAQPPKRRRIAAALGAAAVLIAAIAAVAIFFGGGEKPVAAAAADSAMRFDGAACGYEGPTLIEEGMVTFTLTNSADGDVAFAYIRLNEEELADSLEGLPVGAEITFADPVPAEGVIRFSQLSSGEQVAHEWLMPAGFYVLDCATGDPTDHVWRAAQIEVVAP